MLIKVTWPDAFSAPAKEKWAALDWGEVQKYHPYATEDKPNDPYWLSSFEKPVRLTEEEMLNLSNLGFKLEVIPYPGAMITKMQDRHKWDYTDHIEPVEVMTGKAVQVVIPDMALLLIDEVTWRDDCCTEEIQQLLDDGWRILAVCPPNASRRPDYILGRRKAKKTDG